MRSKPQILVIKFSSISANASSRILVDARSFQAVRKYREKIYIWFCCHTVRVLSFLVCFSTALKIIHHSTRSLNSHKSDSE